MDELLTRKSIRSKVTRLSETDEDERLHMQQLVYNNVHSFIGLLDLDGIVLDFNQTSLNFINASLDDVVGKPFWNTPWWNQCPESTIEKLKAAIHQGGTGTLTRFEFTYLGVEGKYFTIDFTVSAIRNDDDNVVALLTEGRNISASEQFQKALVESEMRLRSAIDFAGIGIWEWDMISGQVEWDRRQFELFGIPHVDGTIPLSSITDVIHPDDRERLRESAKHVLDGGVNAKEEFRIIRSDGTERWLLGCSGIVYFNDSKTSARLIGMNMDITESKEMEISLRDSEHGLQKTNATKSQFLAAANHDLRQPLQSLGFYLATLKQHINGGPSLDIVKKMNQSLEIMAELLEALLDVANLENGSVALQIQDFPIQGLFDKLSTSEQPHAEKKGLTLTINSSTETVRSDPALLQRILENFVANALRYTDSGSISVRCQCRGGMLQVDVVDTGIGIPSNALDSIFDEYYQLSNPVRDRRNGLGLGLSVVKHIAHLLGHRLAVHSVPGEGSTFSVELPLGESTRLAPPETNVPPLGRVTCSSVILLVEDDPLILDSSRDLLQSDSVTVCCARDGDEALEHVKKGVRPDLVITDYRLPGQNGIELMRQLRETIGLNIPCIVMTGDRFNENLDQANLTHSTVLYKPVTPAQLLSAIVFVSK